MFIAPIFGTLRWFGSHPLDVGNENLVLRFLKIASKDTVRASREKEGDAATCTREPERVENENNREWDG